MNIGLDKAELKEALREVLQEELLKLTVSLVPYVSDSEMKEIESKFTEKDFTEDEFIDGSRWLGK